MKASLIVKRDDGTIQEIPVDKGGEIGRTAETFELVLRHDQGREEPLGIRDPSVSGRHCRIYFDSGKLLLKDLGSRNGTQVNHRPLPSWRPKVESDPLEIKGDSSLTLGNTEIELKVEVEAPPEELLKMVQRMQERELEEELHRRHAEKDAQKLTASFRVIMDINNNYCNTRSKARDIKEKFDTLRLYLEGEEEFLQEMDTIYRKITSELFAEEFLSEKHAQQLKDFCTRFSEMWSSRFMR